MSQPTGKRGKRAAKALARKPFPSRARPDAARLLAGVAGALNACHRAGIAAQLAHGAVITDAGYVFAVGPGDAPWAVRTRTLTEFPVPPGDD